MSDNICQEPTLHPNAGENRQCKTTPDRICVNCEKPVCWQHAVRPCPKGRNTIYGKQQHMGADHNLELKSSHKPRIAHIQIKRAETDPPDTQTVRITLAYTTAAGYRGNITLYPGPVINQESKCWRPSPPLARYLARRLGTTNAAQESRTWPNRDRVKRDLRDAAATPRRNRIPDQAPPERRKNTMPEQKRSSPHVKINPDQVEGDETIEVSLASSPHEITRGMVLRYQAGDRRLETITIRTPPNEGHQPFTAKVATDSRHLVAEEGALWCVVTAGPGNLTLKRAGSDLPSSQSRPSTV